MGVAAESSGFAAQSSRQQSEITAVEPASAPSMYIHSTYPPQTSYPTSSGPQPVDALYYDDLLRGTNQQPQLVSQSVNVKPYDQTNNQLCSAPYSAVPGRLSFFVEADSRPMLPAPPAPPTAAHNTNSTNNDHRVHTGRWQWLVPDDHSRYWALWISIFTLGACFVFAFMAGQYGIYQQTSTYQQYVNPVSNSTSDNVSGPLVNMWGPSALLRWLRFWVTSQVYTFDVGYLMAWGARYMPAIWAGEWWRLFSSICIHGSFSHLLSNMLSLVILAVPLEHSFGPIRMFIIFLAAGFGGTFMSMAFEDHCYVYVGASGAVFGFLGLYLADILLNFESMYRPLVRLAAMLVAIGLTLWIEFATAKANPVWRVSHMSHIGGLVTGLVVSFMFLPNLQDRRWKAARKVAERIGHSIYDRISHSGLAGLHYEQSGQHTMLDRTQSCWRRNPWLYWLLWILSALVIVFMFAGLPGFLWLFVMPHLQCQPLFAPPI